MIQPRNLEHLAELITSGKYVLYFTADWCGDCQYIKPQLPMIVDKFPTLPMIEVNRDDYLDVAQEMNVFGIPSFVVVDNGKELGRFVSKARKTTDEIIEFLSNFSI